MIMGYRADGRAAIFDNGVLPDGWADCPTVIQDEALRTAESITERLERNPRPTPAPAEKPARKPRKGS